MADGSFDFSLGPTAPQPPIPQGVDTMLTIYKWASFAGGLLGAYHGYKRHNGSIGWAIGWSLLGGAFWPIAVPVALAQGIGAPIKR